MTSITKASSHWRPFPLGPRSLILLAFVGIASVSSVAAETGEENVVYQAKGDILTVDANNASLRELLAQISGRTGIRVAMPSAFDRPVTITISKPTDEVLRQLLRGENYAVAYDENGSGRRIVRITIMPKGEQGKVETVTPKEQSPSPTTSRIYTEDERADLEKRRAARESRRHDMKRHGAEGNRSSENSGQ